MNKVFTELSPVSFVTLYVPHTKAKHLPINSILTELVIQGEPVGVYSTQIQALRERFNGMYYKFITKLTAIQYNEPLSFSQQENIHALFDELLEMRTLLAKEPISTK